MEGLYLLLKMHFGRQTSSQTTEEVLRAHVDVMHYGSWAQMIHEKRAHMHVICRVKSGISLNYYYREGETCILCAIKLCQNNIGNTAFFSAIVLKIALPGSWAIVFAVVTSSLPLTKHERLLQFLSASYNHISGQCTPKGLRRAGLMNRLMVLTPRGRSR